MKTQARVVVIGGGVVGCSVLYHLTKAGWKDVVLVERDILTSGSTWHAAGGFHTLNGDPNVAKLQGYTIALYNELEKISGQACGLHRSGGLILADTPERMEWLKMAHARARYLGLETEIISMAEAKKMHPLLEEKYFVGAMIDAADGNLDPEGTTHAYAKSARINGAEIYQDTKVEALNHRKDGSWDVVTNKGTIHAEHVVNCGGLWAREVGRMVGLELPVLAMEHMYLVTDEMPEVVGYNKERGHELPHIIDFKSEIYMRQERSGMVLGTYERACVPWSPKNTPWGFGRELLQPDLDRIAPNLELGYKHFPALANAGIKRVINGPFTFTPDGNPIVGPVQGVQNFWLACGVMAGFSQGGGVGLALSQWMVNGDPGFDVWAMDCARFGEWATRTYTNEKVRENYSRRFSIRFPNEELPAARPQQTTALYDIMLSQGAVMGDSWGLETPLWFAPKGVEPKDIVSFRRSNDFKHVKAEVLATRNGVGVTEIANFAKYRFSGPGAEAFLSCMMTNKMPKTGRIILTPMLNPAGKLIGDFTIAKASDDCFYMWGSSQAQKYHMRWFEQHLPKDGSVEIHRYDMGLVGLSIAGPKSRDVLQQLVDEDVSNAAFKFMDHRSMEVAHVPALINRVTYTGDLGYEIWVAPEYQRRLYQEIMRAGAEHGIVNFGMRALLSMRLEKNFPTWFRELRPIYGGFEAGMDRFIDLTKNDFIGREAAMEEKRTGGKLRRVSMIVDAGDADVLGDEPIWHKGKVVGWVTSGGFAHYVDKSMAQGYVPVELAGDTSAGAFEIEIIGENRKATIITEPPFDPEGKRMRG
ncbi:glycine cleavage system protein T [Aestuariivirga litoralis]|uniref:Glycine cleavage system protein T n=1 Tax=Aestuariivirga litoralis TaxID=2650924 RepID=A0A2W2BNJ5_9HYPH|nr:FAD-dependent oxidoreductase [Aestuariivirga litoralis]PZF77819.1 glycine cleavage system protein T [Aestuariivirga litoralis]